MSNAARRMIREQAKANAKHEHQIIREAMASAQQAEARFCQVLMALPFHARLLIAIRIIFKRFKHT